MEEIKSSPPPRPTPTNAASSASATTKSRRKEEISVMSRVKNECLSFTASLQEGLSYVKAFFVGETKKLTAKNERESTEADLQRSKMEVEAADAAEDTKKNINKSM